MSRSRRFVAPVETPQVVLTEETLTIPVAMAKALLAFASKDDTRRNLNSIGLTYSNADGAPVATVARAGRKAKKPVTQFPVLAACDGHTLVTFRMPFEAWPPFLDGKVVAKSAFERSYVDVETRVAAVRKAPVVLMLAAMVERPFPPISAVEPKPGLTGECPVHISPVFLSRLTLVAKACACNGATLVTMAGAIDPVRFDVPGRAQQARVTIMPMRSPE